MEPIPLFRQIALRQPSGRDPCRQKLPTPEKIRLQIPGPLLPERKLGGPQHGIDGVIQRWEPAPVRCIGDRLVALESFFGVSANVHPVPLGALLPFQLIEAASPVADPSTLGSRVA